MYLFAIRKTDDLGRIVLPKALRKKHQIDPGTAIDICEDTDGRIVLRKSKPYCRICGATSCLFEIGGNNIFVCLHCKSNIDVSFPMPLSNESTEYD
jgi:transcriptional pleiotropic regulator of transition state genes